MHTGWLGECRYTNRKEKRWWARAAADCQLVASQWGARSPYRWVKACVKCSAASWADTSLLPSVKLLRAPAANAGANSINEWGSVSREHHSKGSRLQRAPEPCPHGKTASPRPAKVAPISWPRSGLKQRQQHRPASTSTSEQCSRQIQMEEMMLWARLQQVAMGATVQGRWFHSCSDQLLAGCGTGLLPAARGLGG